MNLEISPQPSEDERAAIAEALAAEDAEQDGASAWAKTVLPQREAESEESP